MFNECRSRSNSVEAPRTIQVAPAAPMDCADPCHILSKEYIDYAKNYEVPLGKCMNYLQMFNKCQWKADAVAGPRTIQAAPADPMGEADCCISSIVLLAKSDYHLKMLHECRWRADAVAGPGTMGEADSCDIHSKAYQDCISNYRALMEKCRHHHNMPMDKCR